jgi:hypothetical protein
MYRYVESGFGPSCAVPLSEALMLLLVVCAFTRDENDLRVASNGAGSGALVG